MEGLKKRYLGSKIQGAQFQKFQQNKKGAMHYEKIGQYFPCIYHVRNGWNSCICSGAARARDVDYGGWKF